MLYLPNGTTLVPFVYIRLERTLRTDAKLPQSPYNPNPYYPELGAESSYLLSVYTGATTSGCRWTVRYSKRGGSTDIEVVPEYYEIH
jgi:hypothetical protein